MSAFEKETLISDFKALKLGIIFGLALCGAFFITEGVLATGIHFEENFETYDLGDLSEEGLEPAIGWYRCHLESWQVNTDRAFIGIKSIKGKINACNCNETNFATTTKGIAYVYFFAEEKEISFTFDLRNNLDQASVYLRIEANNEIWLKSGFYEIKVADDYDIGKWNKLSLQFDIYNSKTRGALNDNWSNWATTTAWLTHINKIDILSGFETFYIDYIQVIDGEECNSLCVGCDYQGCLLYSNTCFWNTTENQCQLLGNCGFGDLCKFCDTPSNCAFYNCYWYDNACWPYSIPEIPELEECEGLGITDRLLCEIKNFFYRLFVPSPTKTIELKETLELIKTKFPYNYILEFKDFFIYLKDNINEEQGINFSILNQPASLNFSFWNTTTTIAGSNLTIKNIIQKIFGFLIILGFGFWSFSFIKRIFR